MFTPAFSASGLSSLTYHLVRQREHWERNAVDLRLLDVLQRLRHVGMRVPPLLAFRKDRCTAVKFQRNALSVKVDVHGRLMIAHVSDLLHRDTGGFQLLLADQQINIPRHAQFGMRVTVGDTESLEHGTGNALSCKAAMTSL